MTPLRRVKKKRWQNKYTCNSKRTTKIFYRTNETTLLTWNDILVSVFGFVLWFLTVFPCKMSRNPDGLKCDKDKWPHETTEVSIFKATSDSDCFERRFLRRRRSELSISHAAHVQFMHEHVHMHVHERHQHTYKQHVITVLSNICRSIPCRISESSDLKR